MCVGLYFYGCLFYGHNNRQQIVLISVQIHEPEPDGGVGCALTLEALCLQMLKGN